jgi:DNA-binding CsgD family transcriptional regulator
LFILATQIMEKSELETTNQLLRTIIALLLRRNVDNPVTLREQIELLDSLGHKPAEIATILGRKGGYVNAELTKIRKNRKKEKKP